MAINFEKAKKSRAEDIFVQEEQALPKSDEEIVALVKETYKFFGATLLAGAVGAYVGLPFAHVIAGSIWLFFIPWMLFGMFGLPMLANNKSAGSIGLFAFAFVGGIVLTPLIGKVMGMSGGAGLVATAFFTTALIFGGLSMFAINTTRDFTNMGKMMLIAFGLIWVGVIANAIFIHSPILALIIMGAVLMFATFSLLGNTQLITSGQIDSPIMGALALYIDFFNMFQVILSLFGIGGSDD